MYARELFSAKSEWPFHDYFSLDESPIFWIKKIGASILEKIKLQNKGRAQFPSGCYIGENVFIDESVKIPPICVIEGPAYIGKNTIIRPFAYIRGNVIIGDNCVIGNSTEIKNSILLDNVQVPHFNYVGDSVLGNFVHLGAGAICANLRLDKKPVTSKFGDEKFATNLKKMGAIIGDYSEIACNVVLNPGTVLPKHSKVLPATYRVIP